MTEPAIATRALTKVFERRPERGFLARFRRRVRPEPIMAVDGVTLDVRRGELFGLLGPNGAGKTTIVKLLATLLLPTSGSARVAGFDVEAEPDAVRRAIGVVLGGERALYWRLTARENLWYFSQLYNMPGSLARPRIDALLERVGLTDRADERVENYSKGMKQRLHIARGLLNDPEVLLLDEPTIGLDPHAARSLRTLVRGLVAEGTTIVLTTHYMYEADALSDRVAIINKGKVVALDTPAALKARHATADAYRLEVRGGADNLEKLLAAAADVERVAVEGEDASRGTTTYRLLAAPDSGGAVATTLARTVSTAGGALVQLVVEEPSLEDVFVKLTGEAISRDGGDERA